MKTVPQITIKPSPRMHTTTTPISRFPERVLARRLVIGYLQAKFDKTTHEEYQALWTDLLCAIREAREDIAREISQMQFRDAIPSWEIVEHALDKSISPEMDYIRWACFPKDTIFSVSVGLSFAPAEIVRVVATAHIVKNLSHLLDPNSIKPRAVEEAIRLRYPKERWQAEQWTRSVTKKLCCPTDYLSYWERSIIQSGDDWETIYEFQKLRHQLQVAP